MLVIYLMKIISMYRKSGNTVSVSMIIITQNLCSWQRCLKNREICRKIMDSTFLGVIKLLDWLAMQY